VRLTVGRGCRVSRESFLATNFDQSARRFRSRVLAVSAQGSGAGSAVLSVVVSVSVVSVVVVSVVVGSVVPSCAKAPAAQISPITVASTSTPARNDFT
jgi:hypothetical protein